MKFRYLISLAVATALLTGCNNEDDLGAKVTNGMLRATMESNASGMARAGFDANGVFYWSEGDRLGVTMQDGADYTTGFTALTLVEGGAGQATASFSGDMTGTIAGYAAYPYNDGHAVSTTDGVTTLTYNFPKEYSYTKVDADYQTDTKGKGNSYNPAMWGKIENSNVALKHLGGLFCIKFAKLPVGNNLKLTFTADQKIAGKYTVTLSGSEPELEATTATDDSEKTVSIAFGNTAQNTSGTFYIPVPTGNYTNVRVKILNDTEELANVFGGSYTIARKDLKKLSISSGTITGGEAQTVSSVSEVADALGKNTAVTVSGEVSGESNKIEVPAAQSPETPISIAFQSVASGAKIEFEDKATSGGGTSSVKDMTIALPETEGAEEAPVVNVNMPNTTVTLSSNGGSTTIKEATASTAENTLVVDAGVTITKLIVKKGNVRVKKGATITAIERASGNTNVVKVFVESGAKYPDLSANESFEIVDAAIAEMEAVAKAGGNFILEQDVTLFRPLVVEGALTLDLNGHSIKAKTTGLEQVLKTKDAVVLVRRGAQLTINDSSNGKGSIDYNGVESVYVAVKLTDGNDTGSEVAKLTVNGGTLKGYYYGISGNGTRHGTEVVINGGAITAANAGEGTAIYHPQNGLLTVNGGTVSAPTGIEMRSGTLTVNAGAIKSTASTFDEKGNGSGTTMTGVAVAVSQHVTDKDLKVVINGGTLTGPYALYEKDLQNETGTKALEIKDGIFEGQVYSKDCTAFIKGGTFSDVSALESEERALIYLTDDAKLSFVLGKDCTVSPFIVLESQVVNIDLNKKTLTIDDNLEGRTFILVKGGSLKLTDGNITDNEMGISLAANNAKLELDGIVYKATAADAAGILNDKNVQETSIIVKNSTITSGYYAVNTNAHTNPVVGSTKIVLENSHFIATETALLVNIPSTVNIENCEFSGNHQAAFLRGGTYTIKNSSFTLKAELESTHSENNHMKQWQDGNRAAFAGITIGNYLSSAYQYPTTVAMTGVTVKVEGTHASSFPAVHVCANAAEDKGVTLTYDGSCSFTSTYDPAVEYGTANITVNGEKVEKSNVKQETSNR